MAGRQLGRLAARARNVLRPHELSARAAAFAAQLKAEYEAGLRGDDDPNGDPDANAVDAADDVADALRTIDWATVKAATSKGAGEAAERMRAMAQQVDWQAVQPVAAQVSSALIAAVASGYSFSNSLRGSLVVMTTFFTSYPSSSSLWPK